MQKRVGFFRSPWPEKYSPRGASQAEEEGWSPPLPSDCELPGKQASELSHHTPTSVYHRKRQVLLANSTQICQLINFFPTGKKNKMGSVDHNMDMFKQKLQEKYMKQTLPILNALISCTSYGWHKKTTDKKT